MPDFSSLPRHVARRFVPDDFKAAAWPQIESLYDQLIERNLASQAALEQYLRDWNELADVLGDEENRRYVSMTCQTDDEAAAAAYRAYVTEIAPRRKPRENELEQHYLSSPARKSSSNSAKRIMRLDSAELSIGHVCQDGLSAESSTK